VAAYGELESTNQIGPETLELFVSLVPRVAHRHGFPPPDRQRWSREVCLEWVLDLVDKKGLELGAKLYALAVDEDTLVKVVWRTIENELKDQAKATTVGKLRSRMRTLLTREDDFVDATLLFAGDPAWTLEGLGDVIQEGDWEDLLRTPALKSIDPIDALNTAGRTPKVTADKLIMAARILISAAGGAMRDQVLCAALVTLFELDEPEIYVIRDNDGDDDEPPLGVTASPEDNMIAVAAANVIWSELSLDEGRALVVLDVPLAEAAYYLPHIPDLKSFLEVLKKKLQTLVDRTDLPRGTFELLIQWSRELPDP
jgi:hypothetical protein